VHHDRNIGEALVALDVPSQHVAIHLRHLGIHQDQMQLSGQRLVVLRGALGDALQSIPGFLSVGGMVVLDLETIEHLGDLLARDQRIVRKEHQPLDVRGDRLRVRAPAALRKHWPGSVPRRGIETSLPPGNSVMAVIKPSFCAITDSGERTFSQSTRTMRSTASTRNPCVRLLYSVTIIAPPS
jgi:hypothetical protein